MTVAEAQPESNARKGIAFILLAMFCISLNDMLIKRLSDTYPLHEMIFARSMIGILVTLVLVRFEGGWRILRTGTPWLHLLRCVLIVGANMTFFTGLAVLPLAEATALWFVAPLFITLLSIPLLGERVGPWRMGAVLIGFCGVLLMVYPAGGAGAGGSGRAVLLLPLVAALLYACMQILTRRLSLTSKASALAVYIQLGFLVVSIGFWIVAGDGRFATGVENESLRVLLRAWRWPGPGDQWLFLALGVISGIVGYSLSQAYRSAGAATIAPFEYSGLPLAILWGWIVWGEIPGPWVSAGIVLIVGAGLVVFVRERRRGRPVASRRSVRRW